MGSDLHVLGINSCQKWGELWLGAVDRVRTSLTLQTLSASSPCHHRCLRWWIHPYLAKSHSVKCFKSHHLHLVLQLHPCSGLLGAGESSAGEHLCCGEDTAFPPLIPPALGTFQLHLDLRDALARD